MSHINDFEERLVWRKTKALAVMIYRITEQFPKHEIFALTRQMRRSSVSIVATIAESSSRRTSGALANHLAIWSRQPLTLCSLKAAKYPKCSKAFMPPSETNVVTTIKKKSRTANNNEGFLKQMRLTAFHFRHCRSLLFTSLHCR